MSEAKRVSLQSIGPVKKDKKTKSSLTSIRLELTLPPRDADTYADFNYKNLILNERKKDKSKEKDEDRVNENGFGPLDPYASDDEDKLKEIARSFESKYGTPKKKYRRLEDYTELGTGYDENDSFIDNTDAFDEAVPEDHAPECGGFYINKGKLVLKRVDGRSSSEHSDSDSSEGSPNKAQKRRLESDSESGSSDSSGDSSESDDSEDSEEDDENEAAEIDTEEAPSLTKENKTNGHVTVPSKKPKLSDDVKCPEFSSKKAKNKAITGLFLKKAVREKDHNENRQKLDPQAGAKRISNIDAAIEAVARGEDSKESGIAESKSHSDLSDSYESDESQGSLKVNGRPNGLQHPLPDDLPEKLLSIISALKAKAAENSSLSKQEFFTKDIDSLLLRFEKNIRQVQVTKRSLVYDHLQCYLPCSKESLIKKGSALLRASVESAVREPLSRLKAGIDILMPNAMERYHSVCQRIQNERNNDSLKETSENAKSSPEKAKIPRRRFPWTEELKNLLCLAVRKRRIYFHVTKKNKDDSWDDHLREFLKKDVLPMWETGWMKPASLMDIITKMSADLLQATPSTHEAKKKSPTVAVGGSKNGNSSKSIGSDVNPDTSSVSTPAQAAALPPPPPPTLSPAPMLPQNTTLNPTPPPPPLSAVSPISSPDSPHHGVSEVETSVKKVKSPSGLMSDMQRADGLLDLSGFESGGKKSQAFSGPVQSESSAVNIPNHNNVRNLSLEEMIGMNKLSSLSTSVSLSVKSVPSSSATVQSNVMDTAKYEIASKKRNTHGITASSSKLSHINNCAEMDALNLKSQTSEGEASSSADYSFKKRLPTHHSGSSSVKPVQNSTAKLPFSGQSLETQKSQPSTVVFSVNSSQPYSSHSQQSHSSSTIKVSSVAAINLKLCSQAQPQTSSTSSHPLKSSNLPNVSTNAGSKQSVSTFSAASVISHCMESNNPSLSITPVKPYQQGKTALQSSSASSVQSGTAPMTSQAGFSSWSERSEVIVTPSSSSSMPHIKSNPISSNPQPFRHDSSANYSSSNSNVSNVTVRKLKPSLIQNEPQGMNTPRIEKSAHAQSSVSQEREKQLIYPPYLYSSPVVLDQSHGSSPSPTKTPSSTTTSEKVMVSRKDRILQESRDRGVIDSPMPTLSGPYKSSNAHETSGSLRQQIKARAPPTQNQIWDEDFFMVEELLSTSPTPVLSPKVSTASMDTYKHSVQVPESQRCDPVKNHPPLLEPQRSKAVALSSNSESQRVIVRQAPVSHQKESMKPSSFINSQIRDSQKTASSMARVTSTQSSCILDTSRANVVMTTSTIQEPKRIISLKDEMSDILASIPSQMISRTDHYTINSMQSHHNKRSSMLSNVSDIDIAAADSKEDALQTAQELSMHSSVMSGNNCDVNFPDDSWVPKKTASIKSSSDMSDHRISGMSGLSMSGLDGMGGMGLGLPPHLVGYQNDYQRHLYGSTSKSGQSDHRPT